MGSLRFEGVRFSVYSDDHPPPHVHARYAEVQIVIDLLLADKALALSQRRNSVTPINGSRADVNYILELAAEHYEALVRLWEMIHG